MMLLSFLSNLERRLCHPSEAFFPDPNKRQDLFIRNQWQLRFYFTLLVVFSLLFGSINLEPEAKFFIMGYIFLHGGSCLLFCRTRIWIYYWIYTISSSIMELVLVLFMKEIIIYAVMVCFIAPIFVLTITNCLKCTVFAVFGQIFLINFKYKSILADFLHDITPDDFSERFMNAATFILFAITVLYTLLFVSLSNTNKQLQESKQKAEQARAQLEIFIQTFSHELRNPLNSLLGNIQMTLQEKLSPKALEMIESAKICGDILLQLINNILDTGKINTGKLEVSLSAYSAVEVVGKIWRISRDLIKKKGLNGYLKISKSLPPILHIDYYRMHQILLNLIGNALKFTNRGSIKIHVEWMPNARVNERCFMPYPYDDEGAFERDENLKSRSPNYNDEDYCFYVNSNWIDFSTLKLKCLEPNVKGVLKIVVKDTGCGIRKEDLPFVFNKFAQFHKDTAQRKIGTGLGLYITKEICEKMGGEIRVFSKVDIGTTFIVCIPTYCPYVCQHNVDPRDVLESLKRDKIKALIVDDNFFNIDLLDTYIQKINGTVVGRAQNGSEGFIKYAQSRMQKLPLDVIFLDIDMPILDGKSLCLKIREYEIRNNLSPIKIIFISGTSDELLAQTLTDKSGPYKADNLLKKPISFEIFAKSVRESITT